ncbi:MAG: UTP--glucose-1-phosphate uridylyltransferase GalU [Bacillota bacterium]
MRVRKAVIPVGGLGTRLLPITKTVPKEMLPILDRPAIQYVVEEAVASGIEEILLVTGRTKRAIEDYFDHAVELEGELLRRGKDAQLAQVRASGSYSLHYVRQKRPLGLGDAIACARAFVGDEPFAVLLPDDLVVAETACTRQLIDVYHEYGSAVVGVQPVPLHEVERYGIIAGTSIGPRTLRVTDLVEKPKRHEAPGRLAIMGRYVLTPAVFDWLQQQEPSADGEIQLTDALRMLNRHAPIIAHRFDGVRYDTGDLPGYISTVLQFAWASPEIRPRLLPIVQQWVTELAAEAQPVWADQHAGRGGQHGEAGVRSV